MCFFLEVDDETKIPVNVMHVKHDRMWKNTEVSISMVGYQEVDVKHMEFRS